MRANNFKDMTGMRFGRLTVISLSHIDGEKRAVWKCKCDCGKETVVSGKSLRAGNTSSCGCLSVDLATDRIVSRNTKHGKTNTRLYRVWSSMRNRCNNTNATNYSDYGGRGIKVCSEWENDFEAFYNWAMENGYNQYAKRGDFTIDRIDNGKGYSPDNCRMADYSMQANNRRSTRKLTYKGETKSRSQWAREFGKNKDIFYGRTDDEAIKTMEEYDKYKSEHGEYPRKLRNGYLNQ